MAEGSNNKSRVTIGVVSLVVLLIGGLFYMFLANPGKNYKRWYVMLDTKAKDPYGLYIAFNLLKKHHPNHDFHYVTSNLAEKLNNAQSDTLANYIFAGNNMYQDSAGRQSLRQFVARGNNAFLFTSRIPRQLLFSDSVSKAAYYYSQYSYTEPLTREFYDTTTYMNLRHSDLSDTAAVRYTFIREEDSAGYYWHYFNPYFTTDTSLSYVEIGYSDGYSNFLQVPWGNGSFYIHLEPLVLTNHFLMQPRNRAYAERVLAHMHKGDIYYDEISHTPIYDNSYPEFDMGRRDVFGETPLNYVLSQPSLRFAFYVIVACCLLYVLFRIKRTQRIMPVLEQNTNSSLEFLLTIGRLYFLANDHKRLATKKFKLYLSFIRNRYHISTQNIDSKLVDQIAQKSQVPREHVADIFEKYKAIDFVSEVSDALLIDFHRSIDRFHQTCK